VKENLGYFFVNYQGTRQRSALSPGTEIDNPSFPILPADRSEANLSAVFSTPATAPTAANPAAARRSYYHRSRHSETFEF